MEILVSVLLVEMFNFDLEELVIANYKTFEDFVLFNYYRLRRNKAFHFAKDEKEIIDKIKKFHINGNFFDPLLLDSFKNLLDTYNNL